MSAPESTVLQANFKTAADTLVNVYGSNPDQFTAALDFVKVAAPLIVEVESLLKAVSTVGQVFPGTTAVEQPAAQPAWGTTPPPPQAPPQQGGWGAPAAPPQQTGPAPMCQHGNRVARKGNGKNGEWRAWMCPTSKGTPGQCEPQWVQKNTAEWAGFPA